MVNFIKDIVESPNRVWSKYLRIWDFFLLSYEGGPDYSNSIVTDSETKDAATFRYYVNGVEQPVVTSRGNLFQHKKEREQDYISRIQMSFYYNFCAPILDIYTNHLFKQPINENWGNIEDAVNEIVDNVDLRGSSIGEFRKQMAEMCKIYGHCFVIVDSPQYNSLSILTKQQQIDLRAYPYLSLYCPQRIRNWSLDELGNPYWVLVEEYEAVNSNPMNYDKNKLSRCNYKLWTRDSWALYDNEYNLIDVGVHDLGIVPIVVAYNKKSKKQNNFLGISSLADIAFISRDIYNSCSELKQILRDQTFAILALQGDSKEYDELTVGTSKALLYPPERNAPQYVSPQAENAQSYFEHIDRQISKIYQLAKLDSGGVSGKVSNPISDQQSGVSKAWDFNQTNSCLSDQASNLEDAENKIWNVFAKWLGMEEFEGSIQYPNEFSIQSLMTDLDEAEKASKLSLGETFDLEVRKSIQKKKFPGATPEDLEKMENEAKLAMNEQKSQQTMFNRVSSLTNRFTNANNGGL